MAETGFEIHGRFYQAAEAFTLGDPVLVRDLTGMDFPEFAEAYDELVSDVENAKNNEADVDPAVLIGLVGVAVWHANPMWRRDKVVRFVQSLPMDAVKFVGEEQDDDVPPAVAPADTLSGGTPADSSSSAGVTASLNGSGDLISVPGSVPASQT